MRILVTFAIEAEFAPWRKLREFEKSAPGKTSKSAGLSGFVTTIEGNKVQVLLTGMGSEACEETLSQYELRRGEGPDLVISSGLAGGLAPSLKPGDTIVPHVVRTLLNNASGMSDVIFLERAVQAGADAIIVSNHGGRALDSVAATIDALPRVTDRVARRIPVLMDGGIRRGGDVLKALALGANAVQIGRPYLHGLAVNGSAGVQHIVEILHRELEGAMALTGRTTIAQIDRTVVCTNRTPGLRTSR